MQIKSIELAKNHPQAADFVAWLKREGYDAYLGKTEATFVNGYNTFYDPQAIGYLRELESHFSMVCFDRGTAI